MYTEAIFHAKAELTLEIGSILELKPSFTFIPISEGTTHEGMKRIIGTNEVPFRIFWVRTQSIIKPALLGEDLSSLIGDDYVPSTTPLDAADEPALLQAEAPLDLCE
jgi:hypothetical protein